MLNRVSGISGSDIDPEALKLAQRHINQAGLSGRIELSNIPLQQLQLEGEPGVFLCNPPYGERLMDIRSAETLYREMGECFSKLEKWQIYVLTSDEYFEKHYGRRADKVRKLYNGMLKCNLYQYFKAPDESPNAGNSGNYRVERNNSFGKKPNWNEKRNGHADK